MRTVMANADEAMYHSKRNGKNRLTIFSDALPPQPGEAHAETAR